VILSSLVLAEKISWSQWLGVVLILGGIMAGNIKTSNAKMKSVSLESKSVF
jgi:drug/metabolite transporter (DMT)-like permease